MSCSKNRAGSSYNIAVFYIIFKYFCGSCSSSPPLPLPLLLLRPSLLEFRRVCAPRRPSQAWAFREWVGTANVVRARSFRHGNRLRGERYDRTIGLFYSGRCKELTEQTFKRPGGNKFRTDTASERRATTATALIVVHLKHAGVLVGCRKPKNFRFSCVPRLNSPFHLPSTPQLPGNQLLSPIRSIMIYGTHI